MHVREARKRDPIIIFMIEIDPLGRLEEIGGDSRAELFFDHLQLGGGDRRSGVRDHAVAVDRDAMGTQGLLLGRGKRSRHDRSVAQSSQPP